MGEQQELRPLVLHLKREYWEAIRDGTKTEEYREDTPYWRKRIWGRRYSEVHLLLGYPKRGDESRIIRRPWLGYTEKPINHPHFGSQPCWVFAIDVTGRPNSAGSPCPPGFGGTGGGARR